MVIPTESIGRAGIALLTSSVMLWLATAIVSASTWDRAVRAPAYALGALATAVTIITAVVLARSVIGYAVTLLSKRIAAAPRENYYRGYGDAAGDAGRIFDEHPTIDLKLVARTYRG